MDRSSIKNFAVESRKRLIEDIKYKASSIGITEEGIIDPLHKTNEIETYLINGSQENNIYKEDIIKREKLVYEIENKGFENVVEEVAYTWFNRIIAIRFMEVNNYLPTKTRVLSSETPGKTEPDIITEALDLDLDLSSEDKEKIFNLKEESNLDELFEFLFIRQCNKLNEILPELFEKTEDFAELLLNISFIKSDGVIQQLINTIPEEDFHDQVEIIGWLYQFYNSELKDEVFEDIRKKKKVDKEKIPPATQLFTPDWIVKYLVENSLGRLWLSSHDDNELKSNWKYYIEDVEQDIKVQEDLNIIKKNYQGTNLEDIKIIDPSMGSGHILVYAFDVLMDIYLSEGYSKKDATISIIENNLYGLDIDDRAYQLAYFTLMMKARHYNKSIFKHSIQNNLSSIYESNCISDNLVDTLSQKSTDISDELNQIIDLYENAKLYGSIIKLDNTEFPELEEYLQHLDISNLNYIALYQDINTLKHLLFQTKILSQKYDVVVTNPPYMSKGINKDLKKYLTKNYPISKFDLYAVFIQKCHEFLKTDGFNAMITQQSFMFLKSYEKLRKSFLRNNIINMVHLGPKAFGEISGEVVKTTAFVYNKENTPDFKSLYIRLVDFDTDTKEKEFFNKKNYFITSQKFEDIPGSPMAYWAEKPFFDAFKKERITDFCDVKSGLTTKNNDRFFRYWFEVNYNKIGLGINDHNNPYLKWFPLYKGGPFRKWYGNQEFVVNWQNNGEELKNFKASLSNSSYYFKESIGWATVASEKKSFRYYPQNFIPDHKGGSIFATNDKEYLLGFLNSSVAHEFLKFLAPSISVEVGSISNLPLIKNKEYEKEIITSVKENIELCRNDYDDYETSWNFKLNPLIKYKKETLEESFNAWKDHKQNDFDHLKSNEVRLNEIFADIYSLDVECDIDDKYISIVKADYKKDIKDLISYAVGCMFGRYSLDEEGIICADNNFNEKNYTTVIPDSDAIIPVLDTEYFEDDIVNRFVEFIKIAFGQKHLDENLEFIAGALNRSGNTSVDQIRDYFLNEFFDDHCDKFKSYRSYKSPIYWQFDSGDENGFKCLIYLQRYDPSTVARIRTDYLHKTQKAIENDIERYDNILESDYSKEEDKNKAKDNKQKLLKQLEETRIYDEALAHIANQQIDLNLDDGIKENYAKFQNIPIKTEEQKTKNIDLLSEI